MKGPIGGLQRDFAGLGGVGRLASLSVFSRVNFHVRNFEQPITSANSVKLRFCDNLASLVVGLFRFSIFEIVEYIFSEFLFETTKS